MKSTKRYQTDRLRQRRIRAVLVLKGVTGEDIAKKLGVTRMCVSNVISGRSVSRRVVAALIEAGVPEAYFKELRQKGERGHEGRNESAEN